MFDEVPAQIWILIAIAAVAYAPARYAYEFIAHSPSRRDITQPSEDLGWRTSGQFARSLGILVTLVALAVFVFTPLAAQIASSPVFWPILVACVGAWAILTVPKGLMNGQIQPFIRGLNDTYERKTQPKRFWASVAWNTLFSCLCVWVAFGGYEQASTQITEDQCYDESLGYSSPEVASACNELIADYNEAIHLNPRDFYSYYNRGLAYQRIGDTRRAVADYGSAIRLRPNDPEAYLNRGLIFLDTGKFGEAIADFTRAHEFEPKNAWPLANRGITYALTKDQPRAQRDFEAVRAIDPLNAGLLRGEALLSINAGDMETAADRLTAALKQDPTNIWALRTRAEVYWELGEHERSQADDAKMLQLTKRTGQAQPENE